MFCWNCGKENPDTAVFCDSCGARLVEPQEELPEQEAPVITPHAAAQPTPASDDSAYGRANTESLGEMPAGPRPQAPESEIPFAPSAPQSALRRDSGAVSPVDTRPNEQAPLRRQRDGGQGNLRPGGRGSGVQDRKSVV